MIARRRLALATALLTVLVGCATSKKTVFEQGGTTAVLVSKRGGDTDYRHPITISPIRLSHVLSRIDVRTPVKDGQRRVAGIPLESLELISTAVSSALREADHRQSVAVSSVRRSKRWGIFDKNYLTSFITYVRGDELYIHLSRSDWEIPPRREDNLPEPKIGVFPTSFRIVPGRAIELVDQQAVAVVWKDAIFKTPTRTRVGADGKLMRREILMESPEDEPLPSASAPPEAEPIPTNMSPESLRALADLEQRRLDGEISENRYHSERRRILAMDATP
jgi:hypothetical protein